MIRVRSTTSVHAGPNGKLAQAFSVLCISCGVKIREKAGADSFGLCLKCFYASLAARLRGQKPTSAGEFVSER